MNLSNFIKDCQEQLEQHGDHEVVMPDDSTPTIEFVDNEVFVIE